MATQIIPAKIKKINDHFFQVESASGHRDYTVNPITRVCTCPDALYRGNKSCKHLRAVEALIATEKPTKSAAEYQAEANERFAHRQAEQAIAAQQERYEAAQEAARHELPSLVRDVPLTLEEATQITALEAAARQAKAQALTDEQLLFCAARHAGTPAGTACLTEIANRLTEARMVAARPVIGTCVKVWGPTTDAEAWASLKGAVAL